MEKTKRVALGVEKKKRNNKKKKEILFVENVMDYLKSDSYMFAPLFSVSMKEAIKEKKKKRRVLLKKVGKYLKSDTYMYAPLLSSPLGHARCKRKVPMEVSETTLNLKEAEKQSCKDSCLGMSTSENQTLGHGERVKHMVYQPGRSSFVSGNTRLAAKEARRGLNLPTYRHKRIG